jgi:hypothetical protein
MYNPETYSWQHACLAAVLETDNDLTPLRTYEALAAIDPRLLARMEAIEQKAMDYGVGSRIRVKLYNGKVVQAEITAITNQSTGRKLQIVYGNVTASINPAQITEVLSTT